MLILNDLNKQHGAEAWGPDLRSISFETLHQLCLKTGCNVWDGLNPAHTDIVILSILPNVPELVDGTLSRRSKYNTCVHVNYGITNTFEYVRMTNGSLNSTLQRILSSHSREAKNLAAKGRWLFNAG